MTTATRFSMLRIAATTAIFCAFAPSPASAQWLLATVNTRAEFRGLSLVGDHVAWASGARGTVARTTDGGSTWTVIHVPGADSLDLRSIAALGTNAAIVASAGAAESGQAKMFRTTDAGMTWTQVFDSRDKGVFLDALAFWDSDHGIALSDPVDGKLYLLTTDDGGQNWTRVPPSALPPALAGEAAFAASGTCMSVWGTSDVWIGTGGAVTARVYHSSDRGRTWSVADTPVHAGNSASGIFGVAFRDALHGIAVGGDYSKPHAETVNVALSNDGGRHWHAAAGPLVPAYLSGVAWLDDDNVMATGLAGTAISLDGGATWVLDDSLPMNAVRFHGENFGIGVGPRGRLGKRPVVHLQRTSGRRWNLRPTAPAQSPRRPTR